MKRCESRTSTQVGEHTVMVRCPGTAIHTIHVTLPSVQGVPLVFPLRVCDSCIQSYTGWH